MRGLGSGDVGTEGQGRGTGDVESGEEGERDAPRQRFGNKPPVPNPQSRRARAPLNPFRDVFLGAWALRALVATAAVFVAGYWLPPLVWVGKVAVFVLTVLALADALLLWGTRGGLAATRDVADKLSMGDPNPVRIAIASRYPFRTLVTVLDEAPVAFQKRDAGTTVVVAPGATVETGYTVRPTARGAYGFGVTNLYAASPIGLLRRRFRAPTAVESRVYPSILQMQRYAFLAASRRLEAIGVKRVRRVGHTMEFDQIRAYVPGDDRRAVNWKATARRAASGGPPLYVNTYQDERQQPVVAALDMGRAMRSPFDGLTLLDHSINAALVLLSTALRTHDRAGLVTFDHEVRTVLPPTRTPSTLPAILEVLYRQEPAFLDPTYEGLLATLAAPTSRFSRRIGPRALVLLFANFDTRAGLERQLPYLRRIAQRHRLVVVLFENTGIRELLAAPSERVEDVYVKAAAEGLALEKREIARTLERAGIGALLTRPETLTVDAVNRYLQIKARGAF